MQLSGLPFALLLSLLPLCQAQDDNGSASYVQQYVSALQDAGYTALADVVSQVNSTTPGQQLFAELANGNNYTVFVPTNEAIQNISSSISSNETLLADYLSYHIVSGNFFNTSDTDSSGGDGAVTVTSVASTTETSTEQSTETITSTSTFTETQTTVITETTGTVTTETATATATETTAAELFERLFGRRDGGGSSENSSNLQPYSGIWPNVTLGRTLLNSSDLVTLEGNRSQVLAWTRSGETGNVTILNQAQNITVFNTTTWRNLFLIGINGTFIPPGNLTTALNAVNASAAESVLSSVQVPLANGTDTTVLESLQLARGLTVFVPNNDAFTSEVNQTLQDLQSDQTALVALLQNHYINGTTLYSPVIANSTSNFTSAAGGPFQFTQNATGIFVSGGNGTSAQIVRPDVLLNNGVAHIIDRVFFDTASDPDAASSAYASATSEAGIISTTETAPITALPTPSSSETSVTTSDTETLVTTTDTETSVTTTDTETSVTTTDTDQSSPTETAGGTVTQTVTGAAAFRDFATNGASTLNWGVVFSMIVSVLAGACLLAA